MYNIRTTDWELETQAIDFFSLPIIVEEFRPAKTILAEPLGVCVQFVYKI